MNQAQQIEAAAGSPFEIALPETPTTGFRWHARPPSTVRLLDDGYEGPPGKSTGGAGTRRFRFAVDDQGDYEIAFELKREWEPEAVEHRTVHVTVG